MAFFVCIFFAAIDSYESETFKYNLFCYTPVGEKGQDLQREREYVLLEQLEKGYGFSKIQFSNITQLQKISFNHYSCNNMTSAKLRSWKHKNMHKEQKTASSFLFLKDIFYIYVILVDRKVYLKAYLFFQTTQSVLVKKLLEVLTLCLAFIHHGSNNATPF